MIEKSPANLGIFMEIKYPEPDQEVSKLIFVVKMFFVNPLNAREVTRYSCV